MVASIKPDLYSGQNTKYRIERDLTFSQSRDNPLQVADVVYAWIVFLSRCTLGYDAEQVSATYKLSHSDNQNCLKLCDYIDAQYELRDDFGERVQSLLNQSKSNLQDENLPMTLDAYSDSNTSNSILLLRLSVHSEHSCHRIVCDFHHEEISSEIVELHLSVFRDIIQSVLTNGRQKLNMMSIRPSEEERLRSWGAQESPKIECCMHELFLEQALQQPSRPAVRSWDGDLTYQQLNDYADAFARSLTSRGVTPKAIVPLCFEKSAWTIVALLAVMKCGATFVLTDPTQPESRLRTIIEEVQATTIITSEMNRALGARVALQANIIVCSETELQRYNQQALAVLPSVSADWPMYVIFTSGSTGKPKGVIIDHYNYTSGAIPRGEIVGYGKETRVLDFASYAFDVSIDCILLTLATGGCICVPSDEERLNDLSGAVRRMEVNMVHTTPSIAQVFDDDIIPSLQVLGLGGEAVPARQASKWNEMTSVLVAYGPSECTVGCAFNNNVGQNKSYTSLGKGYGGTLWIVHPEDHEKLMPIGATGELLVSGPIVGPGYLNQPSATEAAFVKVPSWYNTVRYGSKEECATRFYKTGDLVRYDPDGSGAVVFVGRKDSQIKIRGQRVELGEVEHHLRQVLPQGSVVVAEVITPAKASTPALVAFLQEPHRNGFERGQSFSDDMKHALSTIGAALGAIAPKYMIPAAYIPMKEVPIMVSGKTDRKKLRAHAQSLAWPELRAMTATISDEDKVRQMTVEQARLADVWSKVLGPDLPLQASSNFFSCGGDSLKAMRLITEARQVGFQLTIADVFRSPTIESMQLELKEMADIGSAIVNPFSILPQSESRLEYVKQVGELCGVQPSEVLDVYPCSALQEGLMALSAKYSDSYVAQRVLQLPDEAAAERFRKAFEKTAAESPILRTRIVHLPGQGLVQAVTKHFESSTISGTIEDYLARDKERGMGLGEQLCRYAILGGPLAGSKQFVLTMHHAIYDGWSIPLLVARINQNWHAVPPMTTVHFNNFISHLESLDRNVSEAFWKDLLFNTNARQFPELPHEGYQTKADSLLEQHIRVPQSGASTTLATIVRAAWAITVAEATQNADIIIGETITGRNAALPGIERVEGPCITTVPLRLQLQADQAVTDLLRSIQQQTVDRIPHEHLGLQHIRRISTDAYNACELRTGMVLHPKAEARDDESEFFGPADGLVPASDLEAAKEALQFNTYALMLVCTPDPDGFLVMASFDSNTIKSNSLRKLLLRFEGITQKLVASPDVKLCDIANLGAIDHSTSAETRPDRSLVRHDAQDRMRAHVISEHALADKQRVSIVASIWSRLLGVEIATIRSNTSFFDLGGDSIGAMKLVSELRTAGYTITVAQVFARKTLEQITGCLEKVQDEQARPTEETADACFPIPGIDDPAAFLDKLITPVVGDVAITRVYPVRPLQGTAVRASIKLPRYSMRYETFRFQSSEVDVERLIAACKSLVAETEILRTTFVDHNGSLYAVVLKDLQPHITRYVVDTDVDDFNHQLCDLDIQKNVPLGSSFVRFFWVESAHDSKSALTVRISHAQYDEMCLPALWDRLRDLYLHRASQPLLDFSPLAKYTILQNIPQAIPYWRGLLSGSKPTVLPGPEAVWRTENNLISLTQRISLATRPKHITTATIAPAAWALLLSQRLKIDDVVFGEVVSGRNLAYPNADRVMGPCWQYLPLRVSFKSEWTVEDLLQHVQDQHIASAPYQGIALSEVVRECTNWQIDSKGNGTNQQQQEWCFDSMVHQAVSPDEDSEMWFGEGQNGNVRATVQTRYPHLEPLREWKIQSFVLDDGKTLLLEVVTFKEWRVFGQELLDDLMKSTKRLLGDQHEKIVPE